MIVPSECIVPQPSEGGEGSAAAPRLLAPLALAAAEQSVWVSTTASSLQEWALPPAEAEARAPSAPRAIRTVPGLPGLIRHAVMNDRRHVATQDDAGMVEVWDVTRGCCVRREGVVDFKEFDDVAARLADEDTISVPSWFSCETKVGSLTVHLTASQCFDSIVYADEAGISASSTGELYVSDDPNDETKVNLGSHMLRSLFQGVGAPAPAASRGGRSRGRRHSGSGEDSEEDEELALYHLPGNLPIWLSGNVTQEQQRHGDAGGDRSAGLLRVLWQKTLDSFVEEDAQLLPRWVAEVVLKRREMSRELQKVRMDGSLTCVLQSLACSMKLLMSALCVRVRRSQLNFWLRPDPDADWTSSACPAASKFDLGKLTAPRLLRVLKIAVCVPCRPLAAASLSPPTPSVSFATFHCSAFSPLSRCLCRHMSRRRWPRKAAAAATVARGATSKRWRSCVLARS